MYAILTLVVSRVESPCQIGALPRVSGGVLFLLFEKSLLPPPPPPQSLPSISVWIPLLLPGIGRVRYTPISVQLDT